MRLWCVGSLALAAVPPPIHTGITAEALNSWGTITNEKASRRLIQTSDTLPDGYVRNGDLRHT